MNKIVLEQIDLLVDDTAVKEALFESLKNLPRLNDEQAEILVNVISSVHISGHSEGIAYERGREDEALFI